MDGADTIPEVLDAIGSTRSIHRYHDDPIPESDLSRILWAATRAPSGSNGQPFRFVVLRQGERAKRARALLGESFRRFWAEKSSSEGWEEGSGRDPNSRKSRTARAMQEFVDGFERIPAVVLVCFVPYRAGSGFDGASVYPCCQNLLLAARALGYGACITLWHGFVDAELKETLGIPPEVRIAATMPLGRPRGRHGPLRRRPVRDLVFDDAWDQPAAWAVDPEGSRFSRGGRPSPER